MYKRVTEATYLTTSQAWRYRAILRFFYIQHERMREFLFPEEIYEHLLELNEFQDYAIDTLHLDLDSLVKWGNLIARQEMGKARTVEEFKRKRFRFQCTPYTVEFERMLMTLENEGETFGGSLEKTQFERLYQSLLKINEIATGKKQENVEECAQIWEDVLSYFRKITQNTSDYIAYINSEEVEERMQTEAFLVYKDQFTTYLRDFIMALLGTATQIQNLFVETRKTDLERFFRKVMEHHDHVFRVEQQKEETDNYHEYEDKWQSMKAWFHGTEHGDSEYEMLQQRTNESIRRLTRVVQRLGERHQNFRSRRRDYLHLSKWFDSLATIEEAHELSSVAFGVFHTRHLHIDVVPTDDIYTDIWDEAPMEHETKPVVRHYREKTRPGAVISKQKEKEETRRLYMEKKKQEQELISQYIIDGELRIENLPVVDAHVRKILLSWIGKAMLRKDRIVKTEIGQKVKVAFTNERVVLRAVDGDMEMPNVVLTFIEEKEVIVVGSAD